MTSYASMARASPRVAESRPTKTPDCPATATTLAVVDRPLAPPPSAGPCPSTNGVPQAVLGIQPANSHVLSSWTSVLSKRTPLSPMTPCQSATHKKKKEMYMSRFTKNALACALTFGIAGFGHAAELPVCQMLATGGTIAMKIDPVKKAPVPAISGEDLLAVTPEIGNYARIEVNNLSNVPSDYMDPPRWIGL